MKVVILLAKKLLKSFSALLLCVVFLTPLTLIRVEAQTPPFSSRGNLEGQAVYNPLAQTLFSELTAIISNLFGGTKTSAQSDTRETNKKQSAPLSLKFYCGVASLFTKVDDVRCGKSTVTKSPPSETALATTEEPSQPTVTPTVVEKTIYINGTSSPTYVTNYVNKYIPVPGPAGPKGKDGVNGRDGVDGGGGGGGAVYYPTPEEEKLAYNFLINEKVDDSVDEVFINGTYTGGTATNFLLSTTTLDGETTFNDVATFLSDAIFESILATSSITIDATTTNLTIEGTLIDSFGESGTDGQVLSTTGTTTKWITFSGGSGTAIASGTTRGSMLFWDGSEWLENTSFLSDLASTTASGSLTVLGTTTLATTTISGPLSFTFASSTALTANTFYSTDAFITRSTSTSGYFSSTIGGAGLTSCNLSTEKLLYDQTTGQFFCGTDAGGAGGSITTLNGSSVATQTFATTSSGVLTIDISSATSSGVHTFSVGLLAGYSIPLTASTTAWNTFLTSPVSNLTAGSNLVLSSTSTISVSLNPIFTTGTFATLISSSSLLGDAAATTFTVSSSTATGTSSLFSVSTTSPLFTILANGNVGIGTSAPDSQSSLDVESNKTNVTEQGVRSILTQNVTTSGAYYGYGLNVGAYGKINSGTTNSGQLTGIQNVSFRNEAQVNDSGTLNTMMGYYSQYGHGNFDSSSPTTTNVFGAFFAPYARSGVITNMYDLYLGAISPGGTVTNRYSIYQADPLAKSYFAGNIGIGTSSPTAKLSLQPTTTNASLGIELLTTTADRDFSSDSGNWSGTNWSIGGGVAAHTAGANTFTHTLAATASTTYQITFTVNTTATGTLQVSFGSVGSGQYTGAIYVGQSLGTITNETQVLTTNTNGALIFTPDANWTGTLDNISVKQLTFSGVAQNILNSDGSTALEIRGGGSGGFGSGGGGDNVFIGTDAGRANITGAASAGTNNTAVGYRSSANNTTGLQNSSFGQYSLFSNTTGDRNNAFGSQALTSNTTGRFNSAFGTWAMYYNTIGSFNTSIGIGALHGNTTGSYNTALGNYAGYGAGGNYVSTVDSYMTFLGAGASRDSIVPTTTGLTNGIAIGKNARVGASNTLVLGGVGADSVNVGIGTTTPLSILSISSSTAIGTSNLFSVSTSSTIFNILANGNVGIGTANPQYLLEIASTSLIKLSHLYIGGTTNNPSLSSGASAGSLAIEPGGSWKGGSIYTYGGLGSTYPGVITFNTGTQGGGVASPERVRIDATGNVGIGTSSPTDKLQVVGNITPGSDLGGSLGSSTLRFLNLFTSNVFASSSVITNSSSTNFYTVTANFLTSLAIGGTPIVNASRDLFNINSYSGGTINGQTISSAAAFTGTLGIGTSTADSTLTVQAASGVNPFTIASSTGASLFTISNTGTVSLNGGSLSFNDSTGAYNGVNIFTTATTSSGQLFFNFPKQSGTVGILDNYATFRFNGAQNKWYLGADDTNSYLQTGASHNMWFSPGAGGVASSSLPTLVLTTTGGVGIGTTSPSAKLDIWGDLNVGTSSTSTLFVNTATGKVGIGTTTPVGSLSVATGQILAPFGSLSIPGYSFNSNLSTGMFSNSGGTTLSFSVGGTELMRLNQAGSNAVQSMVGQFRGVTGNGSTPSYAFSSNTNTGLYDAGSGGLGITVSGVNAIRILSNQFVGIGTTTPGSLLSVASSTATGTSNLFSVSTSSSIFNVLANGNVGIGTTSPEYLLSINGDISVGDFIHFKNNPAVYQLGLLASTNQMIATQGVTSGANDWFVHYFGGATNKVYLGDDGTNSWIAGGHKLFLRGDMTSVPSTTATPDMTISSGNVGIGTTSPTVKLDIQGTSTQAVLGSEMITASDDRTFTTDTTNWSGTNWTIDGGDSNVATHTAGANALVLNNSSLTSAPVNGSIYQITFTVNTTVAGTLTPSIGGVNGTVLGYTVGTNTGYSQIILATGGGALTFTPNATWEGTIDDVSVKIITPASASQIIRNADGSVGLELRAGINLNTLIGLDAGKLNLGGPRLTALGSSALYSNTTGYYNTAIGSVSLYANTTGIDNTAVGVSALQSNTTGDRNTANGFRALMLNTTGSGNTVEGAFAFSGSLIGGLNTVIGYATGDGITTGSNNTIIGANVSGLASNLSNNIIIADGLGNRRINVDADGNTSLGTTTAFAKVGIQGMYGSSTPLFSVASTTSSGYATTSLFTVLANGNVGVGTSSPVGAFSLGSGQFLSPNGTAAIPSYSFSSRSDTGIYSSAINEISFAVNATQIAKFDASGNLVGVGGTSLVSNATRGFYVKGQAGSATVPTYTFVGDLNNGMFSSASDILNFTTNGVERFRVDDIGNIVLGTSTSFAKFSIQDAYGGTQPLFSVASTTSSGFATSSLFTVLANGNVGIGTSSPVSQFSVQGNSHFNGNIVVKSGTFGIQNSLGSNAIFSIGANGTTAGAGALDFIADTDNTAYILQRSNVPIHFGTNNLTRATLSSTGYLGIGTTSPLSVLSVSSSTATGTSDLFSVSTSSPIFNVLANGNVNIGSASSAIHNDKLYIVKNGSTSLGIEDTTSSTNSGVVVRLKTGYRHWALITGGTGFTALPTSGDFGLYDYGSGYRFVVSSNGNIGIGTTSPTSLLTVSSSTATGTSDLFSVSTSSPIFNVLANGDVSLGGNVSFTSGSGATLASANALTLTSANNSNITLQTINNGGSVTLNTYAGSIFTSRSSVTGSVVPLWSAAQTSGGGAVLASKIINATNYETSLKSSGSYTKTFVVGGGVNTGGLPGTDLMLVSGSQGLTTDRSGDLYLIATSSLGSGRAGNIIMQTDGTNLFPGNVGIGTTSPASKLSILGNQSIGATYAGIAAPTNGLIVEGNVGIGTITPTALLTVASSTATGISNLFSVSTSTSIFNVLANGNVGIGTSTPGQRLEVYGENDWNGINLTTSGAGLHQSFSMNHQEGYPFQIFTTYTGGRADTQFYVGSNGTMFMTNNKVSINGGSIPAITDAALTVTPNGGTASLNIKDGNGISALSVATLGAVGVVGIGTTSPFARLAVQGSYGAGLPLFSIASTTSSGFATSSLFTVLANGNVGVGTSSPTSVMHIVGNSSPQLTIENRAGNTGSIVIQNGTPTSIVSLSTDAGASATLAAYAQLTLQSGGSNSILFQTNGASTKMSIDLNGNVYIPTVTATTTIDGGLVIGTNKFIVNSSSGNVGVGVVAPTWQLQIASTSAPYLALTNTLSATNTKNWIIGNTSGEFTIGTSSDSLSSTSTYLRLTSSSLSMGYGASVGNSATDGIAIGNGANISASALQSIAIGKGATVQRDDQIAIGNAAVNGINVGGLAPATGQIAIGAGATNGNGSSYSVALGWGAFNAAGSNDNRYSVSIGYQASTGGVNTTGKSIAIGYQAGATSNVGAQSIMIGDNAKDVANSTSAYNIAIGSGAVSGTGGTIAQIVLGRAANASGNYGIAIGEQAKAGGYDLALGAGASTTASTKLIIRWNNINGITGDAYGNVGIGTPSPSAKLSVLNTYGSTTPLFDVASTTTAGGATSSLFTVLANGNTGIGTTTPGYKLDVNGDMNLAAGSVYRIGGVVQSGSSKFTAGTGDDIYRVLGNVGIGTTSPTVKLQISGSSNTWARIDTNSSGVDASGFILSNNAVDNWYVYNAHTSISNCVDCLTFGSSAAARMVIQQGGNIGIGTTTPTSLLVIASSTASGTSNLFSVSTSTSIFNILANGNIGIGTTTSSNRLSVRGRAGSAITDHAIQWTNDYLGGAMTLGYLGGDTAYNSGAMYLYQNDVLNTKISANGNTYFMGGNVGIGSSSPAYKLDVGGTINATEIRVNGVVLNPGTGSNWTVTGGDVYRGAGNVGIGTAAPGYPLEVKNLGSTGEVIMAQGSGATSGGDQYVVLKNDTASQYIYMTVPGSTIASPFGSRTYAPRIETNGARGLGVSAYGGPLNFWTGINVNPMTINTVGDISMGTSSPFGKLSIQGTYGSTTPLFSVASTTSTGFATSSLFTVLASGNVGVGTSNPAVRFNVVSNEDQNWATTFTNSLTNGHSMYFGYKNTGNGVTHGLYISGGAGTATGFDLKIGAAGKFVVNGDGNIGIGTTTPTSLLSIASSTATGTSNLFSIATTSNIFNVLANGNVGLGTSTPIRVLSLDSTTAPWIGFNLSGTEKAEVGVSAGPNSLINGSVANDFGIRSQGGNILFSTDSGNTAQLYLKNGGNVGIGTTTPTSPLTVSQTAGDVTQAVKINANGNGNFAGLYVDQQGSGARGLLVNNISTSPDDYIADFRLSQISKFFVGGDGNVGVSTNTPTALLTIASSTASGTSNLFSIATSSNSNIFNVLANGNIGIGTSPGATYKLRVTTSEANTESVSGINLSTVGINYGVTGTAAGASTKNVGLYGYAANASTNWGLWVDSGDAIFDGNVGIGTTTPVYSLDVAGSASTLIRQVTSNALSRVLNETTNTGSSLQSDTEYKTTQGSSYFGSIYAPGSSLAGAFIDSRTGTSSIYFQVVGSTKMLIDGPTGNVGIGATPSTSTMANGHLETYSGMVLGVGGSGASYGTLAGYTNTLLIAGSGGTSATAAGIQFGDNNSGSSRQWGIYNGTSTNGLTIGSLNFVRSNAVNTNALTGATVMTLDSSGYVGIGTTTPDSILTTYGSGTGQVVFYGSNGLGSGSRGVFVQGSNAGVSYIGATSNGATRGDLSLMTGDADRLHITSAGNIGIGTTTPYGTLNVAAAGTPFITLTSTGASSGNKHWWMQNGINTGFQIGTTSDSLGSNSTYLTIAPGGNVGIGTTSPDSRLYVVSSNAGPANSGTAQTSGLRVGVPGSGEIAMDFGVASANNYSWIQASNHDNLASHYAIALNPLGGNVGIGSTTPGYTLSVNGTAALVGLGDDGTNAYYLCINTTTNRLTRSSSACDSSDSRLKQNISPIVSQTALNKVLSLTPVTFNWINPSQGVGTQTGLVAQEVEQLFPDFVSTGESGYKSLNYGKLVTPLIGAVHELSSRTSFLSSATSSIVMSIDKDGRIGIGTTHPLTMLHISDQEGTTTIARFENKVGYCDINPTSGGLVCTTNDSSRTDVHILGSTSTESFSTTTSPLVATLASTTLEKLSSLHVVTYTIASSTASSTGLVTEEIKQLFPDLVSVDTTGKETFSLTNLIPYIVESIRGLTERVNTLATKVAELASKVTTQEVHSDTVCVKKSNGTEVCINGDQLDQVLQSNILNLPVIQAEASEGNSTSTESYDIPTSTSTDETSSSTSSTIDTTTSSSTEATSTNP